MKKTTQFWSTFASLIVTVAIITVISQVAAAKYGTFSAGYGYGVCTSVTPTGLAVAHHPIKRTNTLSWSAVSFTNCNLHTSTTSYYLQVAKANGQIVYEGTIIGTSVNLSHTILSPNHTFKFRVQALAHDGAISNYSNYVPFHTAPGAARKIVIASLHATSVNVSWQNLKVKTRLQYYRVTLINANNQVVLKTNVTTGLLAPRTGLTITGLKPKTHYTVKIQAFLKTLRGPIAQTTFTTK